MIHSFQVDDTIAAQATANEPGYARGIIRVCGPETLRVLNESFKSSSSTQLVNIKTPRVLAGLFSCSDFSADVPVDLLFWPTHRSYTRQVAAEIHTLGSQPILSSILEQLLRNGARLAQPGEFTFRAFLSGRMDLVKAEAVLGVIDAKDQKQLNRALEQLSGGISQPLESIRTELIKTLANLEAGLDFVEEDLEFISKKQLLTMISRGQKIISQLKSQLAYRDESDSNVRVVLFGSPNVGKSSLFNAMTQRYGLTSGSSIVSEISGTTRDFIASEIELDGIRATLIDTAGIDPGITENNTALSPLDLGQAQSLLQSNLGDVEIFCIDSSMPLKDWERVQVTENRPARIVCYTKSDLLANPPNETETNLVRTSALSGEGFQQLKEQIRAAIDRESTLDSATGTVVRCKESVDETIQALNRASELVADNIGDEFVANEIRIALHAIGKITGTIYTDDILDVVFNQFCIGK
ncbi:MAG: tRNA modification GTPase [Planctomycetota bacterium]|nr:tRNA modification GTPase [Planctomycetota bacterium]